MTALHAPANKSLLNHLPINENQLVTNQNPLQVQWQGLEPLDSPDQPLNLQNCTNGAIEVQENAPENIASEPKQKKLGRPVSLTEAYRYILARDGALKYAETIANDALTATRAADRLSAATEIEDRVSGKATQNIRHAGVFMVMAPGAEALAALDSWAEDE